MHRTAYMSLFRAPKDAQATRGSGSVPGRNPPHRQAGPAGFAPDRILPAADGADVAPLAEPASVIQNVPQVLVNVPVTDKVAITADPGFARPVHATEGQFGDTGRIMLRPSGTEELVRVMGEAQDHERAEQLADDLAKLVAAV